MAIDWEKNWPLAVAGGGLLLLMLLLVTARTQATSRPVSSASDNSAALAATVQLEQARMAGQAQMFGVLVSGVVQHEQTAAAVRSAELEAQVARAQADAQLRAIQGQQQVQSQANLFGLIGAALPFIFGLFCWDATAQAKIRRAGDRQRLVYMGVS